MQYACKIISLCLLFTIKEKRSCTAEEFAVLKSLADLQFFELELKGAEGNKAGGE